MHPASVGAAIHHFVSSRLRSTRVFRKLWLFTLSPLSATAIPSPTRQGVGVQLPPRAHDRAPVIQGALVISADASQQFTLP
jgi:hypothetical protein